MPAACHAKILSQYTEHLKWREWGANLSRLDRETGAV